MLHAKTRSPPRPRSIRADLIVDDIVIVEIKSCERLGPVHATQLLTSLRLMDLRLGSFGVFAWDSRVRTRAPCICRSCCRMLHAKTRSPSRLRSIRADL